MSELQPDLEAEEQELNDRLEALEAGQAEILALLQRLTDTDEAEGVPDRLPDVDPEQGEAAAS